MSNISSLPSSSATPYPILDHAGRQWLTAEQAGRCLGYSEAQSRKAVVNLYNKHADEFGEEDMSVIELMTEAGLRECRIFSSTGCSKLGFFARTARAKEFRTWASKVLSKKLAPPVAPVPAPVTPLAPAVKEIGRVLKPGGTFAAVIPTLRKPTDLFRECAGVLRSVLTDEKHALGALSGNAVKMNSVADLAEIFAGGGWHTEDISTVDIDVSIAARPEALADLVAPAFYHYQLLSAEARGRVGFLWTELFKQHRDSEETARFHFPLAAFAIRK